MIYYDCGEKTNIVIIALTVLITDVFTKLYFSILILLLWLKSHWLYANKWEAKGVELEFSN